MRLLLAVMAGAALGFLWHKLSGGSCPTNACPITGNPWISTLWGGLLGFLMVAR